MTKKFNSKLFEKFEDKKILAQTSKMIRGGTPYSNETGDHDNTITGGGQADCADYANGRTDFFNDGYILPFSH